MKKNRKGFSLIEVIAAVALFAIGGFAVSQTCINLVMPLTARDKDCDLEADIDLCLDAVSKVSDYEALDDGLDVDCLDNRTWRVYAEFEQTEIADLFRLDVRMVSPEREYRRSLLVIRPDWYENASDRDDLIKDRSDFLEDARRRGESSAPAYREKKSTATANRDPDHARAATPQTRHPSRNNA